MQDCKVNWRFVFYLLSVNILFSIPESDRKLADMSTDTVAGRNVDTLAFFSGSIFGWGDERIFFLSVEFATCYAKVLRCSMGTLTGQYERDRNESRSLPHVGAGHPQKCPDNTHRKVALWRFSHPIRVRE